MDFAVVKTLKIGIGCFFDVIQKRYLLRELGIVQSELSKQIVLVVQDIFQVCSGVFAMPGREHDES